MIEDKIDRLIAVIEKLIAALDDAADTQPIVHADEPAPEVEAPKAPTKAAAPAKAATKPAKAPAKATKPAPAPEPEPAAEEAATEDEPAAEPTATLQELRAAAQRCLDAGKLKDIVAINTRYGVRRISEVPADKYAEVIAELEGLVPAV
jgi:outer membrane biosynthesis protein TonB